MKIFLALLTKAGKIKKILAYIYAAVAAAEAALQIIVNNMDPEKDHEKIEKHQKILRYLGIGLSAIDKIMGWVGAKHIEKPAELTIDDLSIALDSEIDGIDK